MYADPLAEYTFGSGVCLFHPSPPQSAIERAATVVHELGHQFVARGSTFGLFQYVLGALEMDERVPGDLRASYRCALGQTMKASAKIHEAVAGVYETTYKQRLSMDEDRHALRGVSEFQNECMKPLVDLLEPVKIPARLSPAVMYAVVGAV